MRLIMFCLPPSRRGGLAAAANEHLRMLAPNNERHGVNAHGEYRPIEPVDVRCAHVLTL